MQDYDISQLMKRCQTTNKTFKLVSACISWNLIIQRVTKLSAS